MQKSVVFLHTGNKQFENGFKKTISFTANQKEYLEINATK
jgi:hypothetical protein